MGIEFARFLLVFKAVREALLPHQKTNLLRSAFGAKASLVGCGLPDHHPHQSLCLFERLFEGRGANRPPGLERIPPFVIECADQRANLKAGDTLQVWFNVVAPREFWPRILDVWRSVGHGLGKPGQKFDLQRVVAVHPVSEERGVLASFVGPTAAMRNIADFIVSEEAFGWQDLPESELTIQFVTPLRLEVGKSPIRQPQFADLVRALWRRADMLGRAWGSGSPEWADRTLGERAREVRVIRRDLRWEDWSRYSGSQSQRVDMGGVVGTITVQGDLRPYHQLLAFGELAHVGAGLTSGNGQYAID